MRVTSLKTKWIFRSILILGIVIILSIWRYEFRTYSCKSIQSEAKQSLETIAQIQEAYFSEFDRYADSSAKLGFSVRNNFPRYTYSFCNVTSSTYTAIAVSDNQGIKWYAGDDIWMIDQNQKLRNIRNVCDGSKLDLAQVSDAERQCIEKEISARPFSIRKFFVRLAMKYFPQLFFFPLIVGIILIMIFVIYDLSKSGTDSSQRNDRKE